jgi:hypothetical protein
MDQSLFAVDTLIQLSSLRYMHQFCGHPTYKSLLEAIRNSRQED